MGDLEVFSFVRSAIYGVALMGVMAGTANMILAAALIEGAALFAIIVGLVQNPFA